MINYIDKNRSHIKDLDSYKTEYKYSIDSNDQFWSEKAERITWFKKWEQISDTDYNQAKISWYKGAKLNVSYNCIDRHIEEGNGDKQAIIWEGNYPDESSKSRWEKSEQFCHPQSMYFHQHGQNANVCRIHQ